ncbi:MAG TPA: polysaccharide pyruvyl transferase family protein [Actinomycetota bacterium]|nr:polysaccharide pyruvyl transferase family protein [Actinomycetota bacterium]
MGAVGRRRALVGGWFSFPWMGATAGDLMVRDIAVEWLEDAGYSCDVAQSDAFPGGVDWQLADPAEYSLVAFVCGPLGNGEPATDFFERFRGVPLLGLNLSMLHPLHEWNPFDKLIERDSSGAARPDLAFAHRGGRVPVVGLVLVHRQREYPGAMHAEVEAAIDRVLASRELAVVRIDTCFDPANATGLRTPAEVESLIARMDAVVTTRLHGLVLAVKNGIPALALDPVPGGAKIRRQAEVIGWPRVLCADEADDEAIASGLDWCLASGGRAAAAECAARALSGTGAARDELRGWLAELHPGR